MRQLQCPILLQGRKIEFLLNHIILGTLLCKSVQFSIRLTKPVPTYYQAEPQEEIKATFE